MSTVALQNTYPFIGDETTLHAEGFFMNKYPSPNTVSQQWQINGKTVPSNSDNPEEITITKKQETGSAVVSYTVQYLQQLLQSAQAQITIQF